MIGYCGAVVIVDCMLATVGISDLTLAAVGIADIVDYIAVSNGSVVVKFDWAPIAANISASCCALEPKRLAADVSGIVDVYSAYVGCD